MWGKKEFTKFINYINKINLLMPDDIKSNLWDLINKWNKKNKIIDEYFEMKENHTNLNDFFNLIEPKTIQDELWLIYINKTMDYRVKNMHKSNNLIYMNFNNIIDEDNEE